MGVDGLRPVNAECDLLVVPDGDTPFLLKHVQMGLEVCEMDAVFCAIGAEDANRG